MHRNKTVQREFELLEKIEAGIVLSGAEVKSAKLRGMKLDGAHVRIVDNQAYLLNAEIQPYQQAQDDTYDVHRSRKLLLHRKEILKIQIKLSQGSNLTVVPVSWYNKKGKIKVEIAIAKGRKTWEKKKIEANKTEQRRQEKEMKEYLKVKE